MKELAHRIKTTNLFAPLSLDQIGALLEHSSLHAARVGDTLVALDAPLREHLVLLDGALEIERHWTAADGSAGHFTRTIKYNENDGDPPVLAAARGLAVRAVGDARYLLINADAVDEMLGWSQQITSLPEGETEIKRRMELVKNHNVFRQIPLEHVFTAFMRMTGQEVEAGQTVIAQGETGDAYYLIERGEAEVWRIDPLTDNTSRVAVLGRGDAFGEEALLMGGLRNATVKMATPGVLLILHGDDFNELVRPGFVEEVTPEVALELIQKQQARWLDCRYDMEYEENRIRGAQLMPLDRLRALTHRLDPRLRYVVYCRSGRRSRAAAFLLRERHIKAVSLAGGLKEWPYEIDSQPLA